VAVGKRPHLNVWGNDWPTRDGTGVRDYLHVTDLARGHVAALEYGRTHAGFVAINLGTGHGTSVLEMARAFEHASGAPIPTVLGPRRDGDIGECYADASLAKRLLGWQANLSIERACADGWRWQQRNPNGYRH
jgi:UDP-glucose 4-epimerase